MSSVVLKPTVCPSTIPLVYYHINWLRVLGTAELAQIDQRVCQQLHAIMPLLDAFKSEQQPLEFILPCKRPLYSLPQCMNCGIEQPLAPTLRALAITRILFDVGDQARIEDHLPRLLLDSRVVGFADVIQPNCCHPF